MRPLSRPELVGMPQTMPQPPQLLESVAVIEQTPLQSVPVLQVHVPPTQVSPPAVLQACPQLPQLLTSVDVAVQVPLQAVRPAGGGGPGAAGGGLRGGESAFLLSPLPHPVWCP